MVTTRMWLTLQMMAKLCAITSTIHLGPKVKSNGRVINREYYFREGMTWSTISSNAFSMRYSPPGFLFETKGAMCFCENETDLYSILGYMNSKIVSHLLRATSPTLDFHEGPVGNLPIMVSRETHNQMVVQRVLTAVRLTQNDWDGYETSWNFGKPLLLREPFHQKRLSSVYAAERSSWQSKVLELQGPNMKTTVRLSTLMVFKTNLPLTYRSKRSPSPAIYIIGMVATVAKRS